MKKSCLLMAAVATMFAACSETELVNEMNVPESNSQAIDFSSFSYKTTRGLNSTALDKYHAAGFGVWAIKGGDTQVMANYQVVKDGDDWVYDGKGTDQTLKYWDKALGYAFYAYAPYVTSGVSFNAGVVSVDAGEYAANQNLVGDALLEKTPANTAALDAKTFSGVGAGSNSATTDWMIASTVTRTAGDVAKVEEVFSHTMSKVIVILQSTTEGATMDVTEVAINNVYGSGSYKSTTGWDVTAQTPKTINGAKGLIEGDADTPKQYYCMEYLVIPSNNAPTFDIVYTLNGTEYERSGLAINTITKLEPNTIYTITATIGQKPISFTTQVSTWSDKETGDVDIN